MTTFEALTARHRRELHVHCYRMLASYDEAEDAVQETFLRAWRGRETFAGGALVRAWLYRIATNVCLDLLRTRSRVTRPTEVGWLQPYPDALLDEAPQPDEAAVSRETIELVFLAALQALPPRQRAALIARDVLGLPATETAAQLGTSVAAANSAVQRARATMQDHLPSHRSEWSAPGPDRPTAQERGPCWSGSSTPTSATTPRPRWRWRPRTSASQCRPRRCASTGTPPSRRCWSGRSGRAATASGGCGPPRPTGRRLRRPTCAARATPCSRRSSWMCCASRTG